MKPFPHLLLLISSFAILHSSFSQTTGDPNEGLMIEAGVTPEDFVVKWYGKPGRSYFVQTSETLLPGSWVYVPVIEAGAGAATQWGYANTSGRSFVRLRYTDATYTGNVGNADFDADGLTNNAELATTMTDPLEGDVDDDGLNDGEEIALGTDPSSADSDGDGLNDGAENTEGSDPNDSTSQPNLERWIQSERWTRNQYDTCTLTDAGGDYIPATERYGKNRTTHLNGEWVNNDGYIFGATPFPMVIGSFAPPTNWGTGSIQPVIYTTNASTVIESTEDYPPAAPPFDSGLKRRRWNATNTLVRLRTSAALTYDYELAYQVFRDRRAALSEGPRTRTMSSSRYLTLPANAVTGPQEPFIYAPEEGFDDIYVLKAVPEVHPRTISFSGTTYQELKTDDGQVTFKAPHWYDVNGDMQIAPGLMLPERNRPVAYVQGSTIKLKAKFRAKGFNWQNNGVHVRAKINGTLDLPDTYCVMAADGYLTLPETALDQPLDSTVKFYSAQGDNSFDIAWEFYTDYVGDEPNWRSAGTTKHTVYVVKAVPVTEMRQESLFNIACKTADGKSSSSSDQQIIDAVFIEFADKRVYKVEPSKGVSQTTAMSFKHDGSVPIGSSASSLINLGKGRCEHWATLLREAVAVHGVSGMTRVKIYPELPNSSDATLTRFLHAYSVHFSHNPGVTDYQAPLLFIKSWNVTDPWTLAQATPVEAQGNTAPQMYFQDHVVDTFDNKIYDPSYGASYPNFVDWEDGALQGIGAANYPSSSLINPTELWLEIGNQGSTRETSNTP